MLKPKSNLIEICANEIPNNQWGIEILGNGDVTSQAENLLADISDLLEIFNLTTTSLTCVGVGDSQNPLIRVWRESSVLLYTEYSHTYLRPPHVALYRVNEVIYPHTGDFLKLNLKISRMNDLGFDVELDSHKPLLLQSFDMTNAVLLGCSQLRVNNEESGFTVCMTQREATILIPTIPNPEDVNYAFYLRVIEGHTRPYSPHDVAVWAMRNKYGLDTLTLEEQGEFNGFKYKLTDKSNMGVFYLETSFPATQSFNYDELRAGLPLDEYHTGILALAKRLHPDKLDFEFTAQTIDAISSFNRAPYILTHQYPGRQVTGYGELVDGYFTSDYMRFTQFAWDRVALLDIVVDTRSTPRNVVRFQTSSDSRLMGKLRRTIAYYDTNGQQRTESSDIGYRFVLREKVIPGTI